MIKQIGEERIIRKYGQKWGSWDNGEDKACNLSNDKTTTV